MQKIFLGSIAFLVLVGVVVAFIVLNPPQEKEEGQPAPSGWDQQDVSQVKEQDINEAFLEELKTRHPEGESYVAGMLEARVLLQDNDKTNDLSAVLDIGTYLNLLGEKELAAGWYQGALDIDPINILALNNLANIYDELGYYTDSEAAWLDLISLYPDKPQFYRSLGYLYRYRLNKSPAEIEAFFEVGLEATNNHADLLSWMISYFLEIGDNERFAKYANLLNAQSRPQ
jgi:tetratricopeptide (TPR) repeat protein